MCLACARPWVLAPVPDKLIKQVDSILELTDSRRRNQRELKLKKGSVYYCLLWIWRGPQEKEGRRSEEAEGRLLPPTAGKELALFLLLQGTSFPNKLKGLQSRFFLRASR